MLPSQILLLAGNTVESLEPKAILKYFTERLDVLHQQSFCNWLVGQVPLADLQIFFEEIGSERTTAYRWARQIKKQGYASFNSKTKSFLIAMLDGNFSVSGNELKRQACCDTIGEINKRFFGSDLIPTKFELGSLFDAISICGIKIVQEKPGKQRDIVLEEKMPYSSKRDLVNASRTLDHFRDAFFAFYEATKRWPKLSPQADRPRYTKEQIESFSRKTKRFIAVPPSENSMYEYELIDFPDLLFFARRVGFGE